MSKLLDKLKTYEDFELAFLMKYKIDSYMKERQKIVMEYIQSRNLTVENLNDLIKEYEHKKPWDTEKRCPRCKSNKLQSTRVMLKNTTNGSPEMYDSISNLRYEASKHEETICLVCGFMVDNPNNENWNRPIHGQVKKRSWFRKLVDMVIN